MSTSAELWANAVGLRIRLTSRTIPIPEKSRFTADAERSFWAFTLNSEIEHFQFDDSWSQS